MRRRRRVAPRLGRLPSAIAATATAALAALLGGWLSVSPAAAAPAAASAALLTRPSAAESPAGAIVSVLAANDGVLADKQPLSVSVVVDDTDGTTLDAGTVDVSLTAHPFASAAQLAAWQQNPTGTATRVLASTKTTPVGSGEAAPVATVQVPADKVKLSGATPAVYGLVATVKTPAGALTTATSTVVWQGTAPTSVGLSVVLPITVPAGADGLVSSAELKTDTAKNGLLTADLAAAQRNPQLTLAIDPMLLASVRVLGSAAPASAADWLSALSQLPNENFALQYGDADASAETQAGLPTLLKPSDFDYAMSTADHTDPLTVGETDGPTGDDDTPAPGDQPAPTPSATPASDLPTTAELLAWPYTLNGVVWPSAGSVRTADLAAFAKNGLTTTILDASNTNAAAGVEPDAALRVASGVALVSDPAVTDALQTAMAATPQQADAAAAALDAQLAFSAAHAAPGSVLLAALPRGAVAAGTGQQAGDAISAAFDSPFTQATSLRDARHAPATAGLAVVDHKVDATRVNVIGQLLDREGDARAGGTGGITVASFSSVLQTPALLTGPVRNQLLQLLGVAWATQPDAWVTAADKNLKATATALTSVQISPPGHITQLSNQALIPITVNNALKQPVVVVLRATPSSARLEIDSDTTKTIPAGSSAKVLIPVKSQLGNGTVQLSMQLYSGTDVPIGEPAGASVDVHADWEGIGSVIFGVLVVGFFGFGLYRSIRRRKREKAEPSDG